MCAGWRGGVAIIRLLELSSLPSVSLMWLVNRWPCEMRRFSLQALDRRRTHHRVLRSCRLRYIGTRALISLRGDRVYGIWMPSGPGGNTFRTPMGLLWSRLTLLTHQVPPLVVSPKFHAPTQILARYPPKNEFTLCMDRRFTWLPQHKKTAGVFTPAAPS